MHTKISTHPNVCHGKPVIAGTHILVSNITASLAAGEPIPSILESYPGLTEQDILAALEFVCKFKPLP